MGVNSEVSDLRDTEKKALDELKQLIQTALINHEFTSPSPHPKPIKEEEVFFWGIPLIGDEKSDAILLKFLRTRDFKAKEAFTMIKNTVKWRKEFGIDTLLDEDLGLSNDLENVFFMDGFDKKGHPVCYTVYGEFQSNKDLYSKMFSSEEKRLKFVEWRIQFLEKSIRKQLDFGGVSTFLQIHDLKNSPGAGKWELRLAADQAFDLIQDHYPEFAAKHVLINVPWWYLAFYKMVSPFLPQRTKSKFVFTGPSKSPKTLFKVVSWEGEVSYCAEFVPDNEPGYTVTMQKKRIISSSDEQVICNSFKVGEPGKIVLTFENYSYKKKIVLYRAKAKRCSD
ncbi:hypothetical protein MKW98_005254 [Papaver atlanticum]|uniref:CRAL-TRIO domain-containing protein n=1 Tax=Papaver atlanticum TaxID=357466 RepID=A0AAD4RWE7_9MAGN|nr:hypothetical protein MKW98_005254 [Papaver atlanticum]